MTANRMVLMKGGVVHEVVMGGPQFKAPEGFEAVVSDQANIGDSHNGEAFQAKKVQLSKTQLAAYARERREKVTRTFIDFNTAKPGSDPAMIRIPLTNEFREDIRDLAFLAELTGGNVILSLPDKTVTLTPAQIIDIRNRLAKLIGQSHEILAKLLAGIETGHIASQEHIDFPEKATAVKLSAWWPPHG